MELKELYNPEHYTAVLIDKLGYVEAGENQAFHFYYNKTGAIIKAELWELHNGLLYKLIAVYNAHNGYYGHSIKVIKDEKVLRNKRKGC